MRYSLNALPYSGNSKVEDPERIIDGFTSFWCSTSTGYGYEYLDCSRHFNSGPRNPQISRYHVLLTLVLPQPLLKLTCADHGSTPRFPRLLFSAIDLRVPNPRSLVGLDLQRSTDLLFDAYEFLFQLSVSQRDFKLFDYLHVRGLSNR